MTGVVSGLVTGKSEAQFVVDYFEKHCETWIPRPRFWMNHRSRGRYEIHYEADFNTGQWIGMAICWFVTGRRSLSPPRPDR